MKSLRDWKKSIQDPTLNPISFLQKEMDKVANDFYNIFERPFFRSDDIEKLLLNPAIDIIEDDQHFKVEVEMPGMGEEDIKIKIKDNLLLIQGKKKISKKNDNKNYISREISYGNYDRQIQLPDYVDVNKATASFKKGMLWVSFPKKPDSENKYREIKIENSTT